MPPGLFVASPCQGEGDSASCVGGFGRQGVLARYRSTVPIGTCRFRKTTSRLATQGRRRDGLFHGRRLAFARGRLSTTPPPTGRLGLEVTSATQGPSTTTSTVAVALPSTASAGAGLLASVGYTSAASTLLRGGATRCRRAIDGPFRATGRDGTPPRQVRGRVPQAIPSSLVTVASLGALACRGASRRLPTVSSAGKGACSPSISTSPVTTAAVAAASLARRGP